jgi:hypothetical protein
MTLEQLVYQVEAHLLNLGRLLWRPDRRAQHLEKAERLREELRDREKALARSRAALTTTQRRLHDHQIAAALLTSRIESCLSQGRPDHAWKHALELDKVRQTLAADRVSLPRLEQTCWSLQFTIRQLERRLARLREELAAC